MSRTNELFETELSHGAEHRVDVAMVPGAVLDDFEGDFNRDELFPFENASDGVDCVHGQFGQVSERALADVSAHPIRLTQQDRGGRVAIGDDVDMPAHHSSLCVNVYQTIKGFRHAYILHPKISLSASLKTRNHWGFTLSVGSFDQGTSV